MQLPNFSIQSSLMTHERKGPDFWRGTNLNPLLVGAGGEHSVYSLPIGDGRVAKINRLFVTSYLRGEITTEDMKQVIARRKVRHEALKRSFGNTHVLDEFSDIFVGTLTSEECSTLAPGYSPTGSVEFVPTVMVLQKVLPELEKDQPFPMRRAISLGDQQYAEQRFDPTDPKAFALYEAASDFLVLGKGNMPFVSRTDHCGIWVPSMWKELSGSEWRSPPMREFAAGFARFTHETRDNGEGEALDLSGENNAVYLCKKDGQEADVKLLDVLYPHPVLTMARIRNLLLKANKDIMPEFSTSEKMQLMNGVNYLRMANGIIEFSEGPEDFLNPFPQGVSWRSDIWRRVFTLSREGLVERGLASPIPNFL